jgi:hypothetical protein
VISTSLCGRRAENLYVAARRPPVWEAPSRGRSCWCPTEHSTVGEWGPCRGVQAGKSFDTPLSHCFTSPMDHGQPGSKGPTTYTDLNNVLRVLLVEVTKILGRNLCGAYLQGSFAVGDADVHSDVDWAKHLEGSYVPGQSLRRIDPAQPGLALRRQRQQGDGTVGSRQHRRRTVVDARAWDRALRA